MRSPLLLLLIALLVASPATGHGSPAGQGDTAPRVARRAGDGPDGAPSAPAPGNTGAAVVSSAPAPRDTTFLSMDFEDGDTGGWRRFIVQPHVDSLALRVVTPPPGNRSDGCLLAVMPFESENGFVVYRLESNGLDPVPVTPLSLIHI